MIACGGEKTDDTGTSQPADTSGDATTEPTTSGDATSGDESTGTTTSGSTTDVTRGGSSTTTGEGSTSGSTTTSGETGASTSGDTGTGGDAGTSTGDETTGGGDGEYAAFFLAGGFDRIIVRKADAVVDLCTTLIFVWPGDAGDPAYTVELPAMWGVQQGMVAQGVAGCLDSMMFPMDPVLANGGTGAATWAPDNGCPQTVDVDVVLDYTSGMPWVPDQDIVQATAIPVQGC